MTDLDAVSQWVEGYVRAWNSNDAEDIGRLFTDDASYSTAPFSPPWLGRRQIVEGWLAHQDEPGETTFEWEPVSLSDDVAVIRGTSRYPETTYGNLWVIRLARDGRCKEFAEWWMEYPPR